MRPNLYTCKEWMTEDGAQYMRSAYEYANKYKISIGRAGRLLSKMVKEGKLEIYLRNNSNLKEKNEKQKIAN